MWWQRFFFFFFFKWLKLICRLLGVAYIVILCSGFFFLDFGSHLLDPRSRREFAFDMPVGGENVIGEEKPERGSAANGVGSSWLIVKYNFDKFKVTWDNNVVNALVHACKYSVHMCCLMQSISDILYTCRVQLPLNACTSNLISSYFKVTAHRAPAARLLTCG